MKTDKKLQEKLLLYDTPVISEEGMQELISAGKKYMESAAFNKGSLRIVFLSQLQYFSLSFWLAQTSLAVLAAALIWLLGYWQVPFRYPLTVLAVMIPLTILVGAREISGSSICDMWEIEQSCRFQLAQITACRMLIIGLANLLFLTGVLGITGFCFRQSAVEVILYGMVPFNISCTCYLRTIMKNEKGQISYHLFVCMLCMAAVFSILLKQEKLFEASMLWGWAAFCLFSVTLLAKTVRSYLEHEKRIGELAWSLQ